MSLHLSDDELIRSLYGLVDAEGHTAGCSECRERLNAMRQVRAEAIRPREISGRMLAAQRLEILDRLERPSAGSWRWAPPAVAAVLLATVLFLFRPGSHNPAPPASIEADAELFTDVYSMERDVEPRAAAPIRALFQETSFETAPPAEERPAQ